MKKGTLFWFPFVFSFSLAACEGEKKIAESSKEVELLCTACDKYLLTMSGSFFAKNIMYWEAIKKPAILVKPSDISQLLPLSSLPAIHCADCKATCLEPVWHASGTVLKAAYRAIGASKKGK